MLNLTKALFLLLLSVGTATLFAQQPFGGRIAPLKLNSSSVACQPSQSADAGTFTIGTFIGQSNDIDLDTIYLCFGDSLLIDHDGNMTLGDPNTATRGGVGYAFYDCPPTVGGDDLALVQGDPCLANNTVPPPSIGLWMATEGTAPTLQETGDVWFFNNGLVQNFFLGGNAGVMWFAPITYDDYDEFAPPTDRVIYEGNPAGPCIDVNLDQAFAVAYLNPIDTLETDITGCRGEFCIVGGLPELEDNFDYTVTMSLDSDPSVQLNVQNLRGSGCNGAAQARFRFVGATQNGIYNISVSDGKSCTFDFQVELTKCVDVLFDIGEVQGEPGDTVCVPIYTSGFNEVLGFQFTIDFDSSLVQVIDNNNGIGFENPQLTDNGAFPVFAGPVDKNAAQRINISWSGDLFGTGTTLTDSSVLFEICFVIVGDIGQSQPLDFGTFNNPEVSIVIRIITSPLIFPIPGPAHFVGSTGSINIINILPLTLNLSQRDVSCAAVPPSTPASDDGVIFLTPNEGIPPYEYLWQRQGQPIMGPGNIAATGQTDSITGLAAGTYYITLTDGDNPATEIIDSVIITAPANGLGVNPMATDPLCFGDSTGTFNIVVNGGTTPYSYLWNTSDTTQNLIGLAPGFYSVIVTDANNCTSQASATLFNPPLIVNAMTAITASCIGVDNGAALTNTGGGTVASGEYSYLWSTVPPQDSNVAINLAVGTYTVTITDDNNCELVDTVEINALTELSLTATLNDILCFGDDDGQIVVTPQATGINNGGYTFMWMGPGGNFVNETASNLPAGNYEVTITDAVGCMIDSAFTITEPDSLAIELVGLQNELCPAGMNGSIQVNATGGTINPGSDYTYTWNGGALNGPLLNGLVGNTYTLEVTDDNNCVARDTFIVLPPLPPVIDSFQVMDTRCPGSDDGEVTVFATAGGSGIATYEWSVGGAPRDSNRITGLVAAEYIVTVTDSSGCFVIDTVTVGSPPEIQIIQSIITPPTCFGDSNGQVALQILGGTPPLEYNWSNNQMTNPAIQLAAGVYTVSITDANNCPPVIDSFIVPETPPVTVTIDTNSIRSVSCFNGDPCDGVATAIASGGGGVTGRYTYTWSSGFVDPLVVSSTAADLCQGLQTVIAADAAGCSATATVEIPAPDPIELDLDGSIIEDITCFNANDGRITAMATGGVPGYTYFWPASGTAGPTLQNLGPNNYLVRVTDANNCVDSFDISIAQPDPLTLRLDSAVTQNPTCEGDADGVVGVIPAGGNIALGGENYSWSTDTTNASVIDALSIGTYAVTVTDVKGCTATLTHTLTAPPPIEAVFAPFPDAECFGQAVTIEIDTIFGGSISAYTTNVNGFNEQIVLDFPHPIAPVPAGTSTINILDRNGCLTSYDIFINQPPEIIVDLGPDITIDLGDSFNIISAQITNGQDIGTFASIDWSPLASIIGFRDSTMLQANVSPLVSTTYTLTVVDTNGCFGEASVRVDVNRRRNVYIPNVFSPNEDGINDFFEIVVGQDVRQVRSMNIFDRWGENVFSRSNFSPGQPSEFWDGTFRGQRLNPGVFVYLIEVEFVDGRILLYRGSITLVR